MYDSMQRDYLDDVNNVNKNYKPLFNKKEYHKLAWVGRVNDPQRQLWVEWMKERDPNFVDDGDQQKGLDQWSGNGM